MQDPALSDLQVLDDLAFMQDSMAGLRNNRWDHSRLLWDDHVEQLMHEDRFGREYRMPYAGF